MHSYRRKLITIFIIQTTEVLGFSLVLPYLPLMAREYGASIFQVGMIFSAFSLFQFVSAPIMGRLSDYYGRRPLLMLSQLSTTIGFLVLAFATNIWMILLSRIIDGALGSNFTIAQAYLSDISSKKDRSVVFGISGVAFGVGFLIGPAIGGILAEISYVIPALLAAVTSIATIVMTYFFLPETINPDNRKKIKIKIIDISAFKNFFAKVRIRELIFIFFAFILAHQMWVSNLALFADETISLGAREIGITLGYIGLISIIFRGFLLKKLINRFGEPKLTTVGFIFMVTSLALSSVTFSWIYFALVMGIFAMGTGMIRPLVQGEISRQVPADEQGSVLGVVSSMGSIAQILGPLTGAFLLDYAPASAMALVAAAIACLGLGLWFKQA